MQVFIILSCLISISVNFSTFLVIGKTSPVTYQVLGHLKTCLVLAFGYILLQDPFSWRNILGILIALMGMILYSYYCTLENQQKAVDASSQASQVCSANFACLNFCTVTIISRSTFCHYFFLTFPGKRSWIWSSDQCGKWKCSCEWYNWTETDVPCMEQEQWLVCLMGFGYSIVKNSYSPYRGLTPMIHLELGSGIAAKYMSLSFFSVAIV